MIALVVISIFQNESAHTIRRNMFLIQKNSIAFCCRSFVAVYVVIKAQVGVKPLLLVDIIYGGLPYLHECCTCKHDICINYPSSPSHGYFSTTDPEIFSAALENEEFPNQ